MVNYSWIIFCSLIILAWFSIANHLIFILLKIKKTKALKAKSVARYFIEVSNKKIFFLESPAISHGFGVHYLSSDRLGFIISPDLLRELSEEDLKEIVINISKFYEHKKIFVSIMNNIWAIIFTLPFGIMNVFSLFTARRLYIIEKYFALPIYYLSQAINKRLIKTLGINFQKELVFRKNSMLGKIDNSFLGCHLLFFFNSSFYCHLRGKHIEP